MTLRNVLFLAMPLLIMSHSCDDDVADAAQIDGEYTEIPVTEEACDPSIEDRETVDIYENERGEIRVLQHSEGPHMVIAPNVSADLCPPI